MSDSPTAVVVSAHGTPETLDQLPDFLANIRHGQPAPPDLAAEVRRRYEAIGGRSPLLDVTHAQAAALEARLGLPVRVAMRLWHPYPAEVLPALQAAGVRRVVSLPLAPYSTHVYHDALRAAARALPAPPLEVLCVPPWNREPAFVRALAAEVTRSLGELAPGPRTLLVFSAHSLPLRVIQAGDPYAAQFEATAADVAAALGPALPHRVAYQSQGLAGGAWLGPDLPATFRAARAEGFERVLVAPVGFLADHVEVLYDLDVEAHAQARAEGLAFARTRTLGAAPGLLDALEALVRRALAPPG